MELYPKFGNIFQSSNVPSLEATVTYVNAQSRIVRALVLLFAGSLIAPILSIASPAFIARSEAATIITTEAQLLEINGDLTGNYQLGTSIELSPIADHPYITGYFEGTFDGHGFELSGLSQALFDRIDGSVSHLNISTTSTDGGISGYTRSGVAGVLAGDLGESGVVDDVHASGLITTGGYGEATGGLVGSTAQGSIISHSSSSVDVTSSDDSVGGLVASSRGTIINSSSSGSVHSTSSTTAGGLVGSMFTGSIDGSFSTSTVNSGGTFGNLVGATIGSVTISRSAISSPIASLIGFIRTDDGDGTYFDVVVTDIHASDSETVTNPSEWEIDPYINSGARYIKALKTSGFYTDTTPVVVITSSDAKARAAAEKRQAEKIAARADITGALFNARDITVETFAKADIAGVTPENIADVQSDLRALPADTLTDINQVLKVIHKYEVLGAIASERISNLHSDAFIEIGLIPATSTNKASLVAVVKKLPPTDRDSYAEIKAAIDEAMKEIQARKDRLSAVIARNAARDSH